MLATFNGSAPIGLIILLGYIAQSLPDRRSGDLVRHRGGDAQLMANIVTFQVVAAAVTLPIFIYIAGIL